jgi:hypothetical protein
VSYVVDSNSFRVLGNYYPDRFPTLWAQLDGLVEAGRWASVREVKKELDLQNVSPHVATWAETHKVIFTAPSAEELQRVAEILAVEHFQQLIGAKQRLRGSPVADPFIVANAMVTGRCVVTEESHKEHAAKIPNVCEHFGVDCVNLEELMAREGWRF